MNFEWLSGLVSPVMQGLDALFTSDDERGKNENAKLSIQRQLFALETAVQGKLIELEQARMDMVAKIAAIEAQSDAWYVKARRPLLEVLTFLVLAADAMGWLPAQLNPEFRYGGWILLGVNNGLRGGMQIGNAVAGAIAKK